MPAASLHLLEEALRLVADPVAVAERAGRRDLGGFGRVVASEKEVPIISVHLV